MLKLVETCGNRVCAVCGEFCHEAKQFSLNPENKCAVSPLISSELLASMQRHLKDDDKQPIQHATRAANANDPPMQPMTKAEESAAMPMPGQANDHSTLASDPRKP